jgi:hypothetical protein
MEEKDKRMYVISHELAQGILDYLTTKPYREVAGFVSALHGLPRLANPPAKKEEKPK